ncbi:class I SAM-dependent methyltransferase [Aetokthonos hydrillicola Thurmond2011]|jgi:SAM-dependent methyltransferase|uniref:Class I SAM-dependent methyltransferase n=1 Tax=Aetokthonos hydrillicola Thurmond2011 TaxID=2712845 RepID=A0AAP5I1V5_9CYAN|nr:class I SAM-dependent methyltransferase [Aetokthonos hydrillicola]MBO3460918.1 class I SAM-dependent methyltransferase [Aetokthonos hydrillicola CCALA 1050]MBW4586467.1 class I SAM-dependent methyltransferase [Aetokthonos hydrillicola CCALA 1050]MDR9893588.1 class I SAM-dependent methyltransferase [Aetokthonos hydrillicola Thurmond2011]
MSFAYKISGWNRQRKWKLFLAEVQPTANTTVLDLGFSEQEYSDTDNFLEKHYPYEEQITALCIEIPDIYLSSRKDSDFKVPEEAILRKKNESSERYPHLKIVNYDGKIFPFDNQTFDVCWSNAVLEHVGNEEEQILFLKEIKRVAKKAFITTPNKYFPVELHTRTPLLHFLPKKIFDRYLHSVGKGWAANDYMYLLSIWDLHKRLRAAGITNYKIIKNRLLSFVMDFVIIFEADQNSEKESIAQSVSRSHS